MAPSEPDSNQLIAPASSQVLYADPDGVERRHTTRPVGRQESARVWRHRALSGVELFHGSFRKHDFAPHYHSAFTIGVVDRGLMRSWCRRANQMAPAGTIILYNAQEVHAPGPGNSEGWSFRTFYIDDSVLRRMAMPVTADRLSFVQPLVQDQLLARRLLNLHHTLEQSTTSLGAESSLLEVVAQITERFGGVPSQFGGESSEPEKIGRVRDYIHAHYEQEVTLAKLAEIAEFSQYHLLRAFRKAVGLTPHAYLIQTRIEAAKDLLRCGLAPSGVALSTGFVDQSHFNRHFKRLVGATPGQYCPEARKSSARPMLFA